MIIKLNITGMPSTRLKLTSKLFTQLHVERKTDEFGRRVSTSWTTGNTEVTLERYHSNKNSKDIDGVIYVGRSFQQYMDKFDADLGLRLATVRAFNKFFILNGQIAADAKKLAAVATDIVMANKDKKSAVVGAAPAKKVKTVAKTAAAKKRGRPAKADKAVASTAKASVAPKKRGRPRKQPV
ncbi:MAG: hypothetical protein J6Q22_05050 [Prevotella sp.]|nr:hypothetical protein [Prevotella sp.]